MTISTPSPALAAAGLAAPSRKPLPILTEQQRTGLRPELLEVIENRKSGLSLNHVVGCPLDCGYCVRHLFDNFAMKVPRALMSDEQAVEELVGHRFFQPHLTPVQLFNRATDPMLPAVNGPLESEQLLGLRLQAEVQGTLELLRSATSRNARLLGLGDRGRVAPGQLADLVLLPGDPFVDPSVLWTPNVDKRVFLAGKEVTNSPS